MEEHYIKDVGKITYVYGVNLEEHKTVIEKQQKRIAELEQKCLLYEKEMLNCSQLENGMSLCIVQKQRIAELEQELAELKEKAIVPKFSSGQIVYFANIVEGTVNKFNYIGEDKYNYVVENKTGEVFIRMKERTFATEQEAQEKLKEIQGNE